MSAGPELVDVLDESGNVTGRTTTIPEAHHHGYLHRIVIGEGRDLNGNIILVRIAEGRADAGRLISAVGGHVRTNEPEAAALKRETLEELGLEPIRYKHLGRFVFNRMVLEHHENHLYSVFEVLLNPAEIILGPEATEIKLYDKQQLALALHRTPEEFGEPFHAVIRELHIGLAAPI